jgi:hypothetical protein
MELLGRHHQPDFPIVVVVAADLALPMDSLLVAVARDYCRPTDLAGQDCYPIVAVLVGQDYRPIAAVLVGQDYRPMDSLLVAVARPQAHHPMMVVKVYHPPMGSRLVVLVPVEARLRLPSYSVVRQH